MNIQDKIKVIKTSALESHGLVISYESNKQREILAIKLTTTSNGYVILNAWDVKAKGFRSFILDKIENIRVDSSLNSKSVPEGYVTDKTNSGITSFAISTNYNKTGVLMSESEHREILSENSIISENILIIESTINHNNDTSVDDEIYKVLFFKYLNKEGELNAVSGFLPYSVNYSEKTKKLVVVGTKSSTEKSISSIRSYFIENITGITTENYKAEDVFDAVEEDVYNTPGRIKSNKRSTVLSWIGMSGLVILGVVGVVSRISG